MLSLKMPIFEKKYAFHFLILLLVFGVFFTVMILWATFKNAGFGYPEVFEAISSDSSKIFESSSPGSSPFFSFSFVIPRGEVVKFFETVNPLLNEITEKVGKRAQIDISNSDQEIINKIETGRVTFGAINAASFAKFFKTRKIFALLERVGKSPKCSYFLADKNSSISSLSDLNGKMVAFKNPNSVSGYLWPKFDLKKGGFLSQDFLFQELFNENQKNAVQGLLNGDYHCAVVSSIFYEEMNPKTQDKVKIIFKTSPMPGGVYIASTANQGEPFIKSLIEEFQRTGSKLPSSSEFAGYFRVSRPNLQAYEFLMESKKNEK